MQTPYRIEFYNRNTLDFDTWCVIETPTISFDYLTLQDYSITGVGIVEPQICDFAQIIHGNDIIAQGVLMSFDPAAEKQKTTYKIKPLQALLDFEFPSSLFSVNSYSFIENLLYVIIDWGRFSNPDETARLPSAECDFSHTEAVLPLDDGDGQMKVVKFWDYAIECLKQFRIVINMSFDAGTKLLYMDIRKNTNHCYIEADLQNIISKTFNLESFQDKPTSVFVIDEENTENQAWFSSGTSNGTWTVQGITVGEDENFLNKAQEYAEKALTPSQVKNTIEIVVRENDEIVTTKTIGDLASIRHNGEYNSSILTSVEIGKGLKKLTFGESRFDLTQKLQIQRRKQ